MQGIYNGVTAGVTAAAEAPFDARAKTYADWILEHVCKGDKNAIIGMAVEINPRVDAFGIFGGGVYHTTCKNMRWDVGYITVQGGDYPSVEVLYVQRAAKINGVSIPQL